MRVGLVLGAGGVLGGAWLTGSLKALAEHTDWDPGSAEYVVGTSAGSVIGSLVAAGVPPWFMVAHSAGESFDGLTGPDGRPASEASRSAGGGIRLDRSLPRLGPGSLRMAWNTLGRPLNHTPLQVLAGWLPAGLFSTDPIKDTVRRAVPKGWAPHPNFWAVATDYRSGKRTVFGRMGAPRAELADAVAASCAVPGLYRPVKIGNRHYVDGGVCSASNLDLLAGKGLDLVICINPMSSRSELQLGGLRGRVSGAARRATGQRLGHEAKKVRASQTDVVLIQPTDEDVELMGHNLMSSERRHDVIELAIRTVGEQLRDPEITPWLGDLPVGEPHKVRRPSGKPSSWPELLSAQGSRRAA
jgi:NTE family protein